MIILLGKAGVEPSEFLAPLKSGSPQRVFNADSALRFLRQRSESGRSDELFELAASHLVDAEVARAINTNVLPLKWSHDELAGRNQFETHTDRVDLIDRQMQILRPRILSLFCGVNAERKCQE